MRKKVRFLFLLCGLSALPPLGMGAPFDWPILLPAILASKHDVVGIRPNVALAEIRSAAPNTSNGIEAFSGNKSFPQQFNPSNPCSIDGIIWVSAGGCYTTIAAALTALGSAPGTIVVPPGTWTTPSTIAMATSGQHIQCAGIGSTIISYTGGGQPQQSLILVHRLLGIRAMSISRSMAAPSRATQTSSLPLGRAAFTIRTFRTTA